jgi:hypothetical protein
MRTVLLAAVALAAPIGFAQTAHAAPGDPVKIADGVTFDPIVEGRLRYESVEQPTVAATAVTMRLRAGFEVKSGSIAVLAEGEGTFAFDEGYNAFPFAIRDSQRRPRFATIPDPQNVELNRLQLQYKSKALTATVGRQRINIDDQRWVGSVGWRQNEQTFDAVRAEAALGPVSLDGTYAISQRTIFGVEAGPRQALDGDFVFGGAGVKLGPVAVKGFAYLLDYSEPFYLANSSQTYGARAVAAIPIAPKVKLNLAASYARQSDYKGNPFDYSAEYLAAEVGTTVMGVGVMGGYEKLGSDNGRAVQTPMATLHKFNGWADLFLTTPANGLTDMYVGASYKFDRVKFVKGLNAAVTWHDYNSDARSLHYGSEWNASIGYSVGPAAILFKFADYDAKRFGVDTRKIWMQAEFRY